jgi:hypothetical protein
MDSVSFYAIPEWAEPGIHAVAFVLARSATGGSASPKENKHGRSTVFRTARCVVPRLRGGHAMVVRHTQTDPHLLGRNHGVKEKVMDVNGAFPAAFFRTPGLD